MELVYLWIEDYGGFTDTGFNFSNMFKFKYNKETSSLTISDFQMKNANQFLYKENIENLSVVVGDNGAGKTSLLKGIIRFFSSTSYINVRGFVAAFYDRDRLELKIFNPHTSKLNINSKECKLVKVNEKKKDYFQKMIQQTKLIYINNVLEIDDYIYQKNNIVMDLSVGGLIRNDFFHNRENDYISSDENPIFNYFNSEVYRQLNFLYEYKAKDINNIVPFELPKVLKVKVSNSGQRYNDIIEHLQKYANYDSENLTPNREKLDKQITTLVHTLSKTWWGETVDLSQKWLFYTVENLFLNVLLEVTSDMNVQGLSCLLDAYRPYQEGEDLLQYLGNYLDRVKDRLENISISSQVVNPYREFLKWLEDIDLFEITINTIEYEVVYFKLNEPKKEHFQEFFTHYNKTCKPYYYLSFSWGLSTGENNLLSLYARLYSIVKFQNDEQQVMKNSAQGVKCKNLLFLIDEADLSFHPKWQIQYVDVLLRMITTLFQNYRVQIILTTHSPILLSDFPKNNVIYLKQGVNDSDSTHKETFGQNIHTLFTDAFFLGKDKATGHFSDRIIQEVGEDLDEIVKGGKGVNYKGKRENQLDYYKTIISIIGEPIIRKAFEFKLKEVEATYQTEKLKEVINLYDDLSAEDRDLLIQHIISQNEKDINHEEN